MNTEKDILLRRIANHLILHSIDIEDIGLFHGKMGVVLFFAHYARYTDSAIYDDFAGELLEEICENIPETLPINLETGLCGIGWGIEYLIQNGFMEGDSNEQCYHLRRARRPRAVGEGLRLRPQHRRDNQEILRLRAR